MQRILSVCFHNTRPFHSDIFCIYDLRCSVRSPKSNSISRTGCVSLDYFTFTPVNPGIIKRIVNSAARATFAFVSSECPPFLGGMKSISRDQHTNKKIKTLFNWNEREKKSRKICWKNGNLIAWGHFSRIKNLINCYDKNV